jgi:hypothetical protein
MTSDNPDYASVRKAWLAQAEHAYAVHHSHLLKKRAGAVVGFDQLCATLARTADIIRNRQTKAREPQDEAGNRRYSDGFALVDDDGVGLIVRLRETGEEDAPSYTYFHATTVGCDYPRCDEKRARLVLAADLVLVDEVTLEPIRTLEKLTITVQSNLFEHEMDSVNSAIAREFSRLGYSSESHPYIDAVDGLWALPAWPDNPDLPLKRMEMPLMAGVEEPSVDQLLAALAHIYNWLADGVQLNPKPIHSTGRAGLGADFALLGDATHGVIFGTNFVDEPEQFPKGRLGISLRSVGLPDLFIACGQVMSVDEAVSVTSMKVDTYMTVCVTGSACPQRFELAMEATSAGFGKLGFHVTEVVTTTAGRWPP